MMGRSSKSRPSFDVLLSMFPLTCYPSSDDFFKRQKDILACLISSYLIDLAS